MITKKLILIFTLFIFTVQTQANDKITLYLDWLNQFQFAGYYIAKEKGYYNSLGLDVNIKEFTYNSNVLKEVINNDATYGVGKSSLIIDKFDNNNIILLSAIFQKSPMVLISLSDSNINTPKDLKNKNIMITDDAITSATINSMIVSQGVKLSDINIQKHSFDIDDLINKKTDSMACFLSNEPYALEKQNIKYNVLNPNEYNFDFYEGILYTSQKELSNNPNRVCNFNKASLKGWDYAFNHIEETAKLIYEKYNTQNKSLDALIYEGNVLRELSKIDEKLLGNIDTKRIDEIKRFYTILGLNNLNSTFDTNSIILNKTKILFDDFQTKYLENNNFALLVENDKNIPFSFRLNNQLTGIEIDIWNLISKKISKEPLIKEISVNTVLDSNQNSINVEFAYGFEKKETKGYLLSDPIAQIPIVLLTTENKNIITNLSNLKHVQIGVLKNLNIISTLQKEYSNIEFIPIESTETGINKLEKNEIFALIDDLYTISHKMNKDYSSLKINSVLDYELNLYLQVLQKDSEFIKILNNTINRFTQEEIDTILNNYQFIFYSKQPDYYLIFKIVLPLIFLLILFIYFNIKMREEIRKRKEVESQLSELANKDSLTRIFNRRKIEETLEIELDRVERYKNNLSIIFFDIDDFKYVNDTYGHNIGDEVLIKISDLISRNIRITDSIGRWGGDEFLIILPQTTISQCENIILDFEQQINMLEFRDGLKISCSFGTATYNEGDNLDSLLKRADESMYYKKINRKKIKN